VIAFNTENTKQPFTKHVLRLDCINRTGYALYQLHDDLPKGGICDVGDEVVLFSDRYALLQTEQHRTLVDTSNAT